MKSGYEGCLPVIFDDAFTNTDTIRIDMVLNMLKKASNNMILLFDGDLELNPKELTNFMILDKSNKIDGVFGSRINYMNPMKSILCFGNFFIKRFHQN